MQTSRSSQRSDTAIDHDAHDSRLLALPPELRNAVYRSVLVNPEGIVLTPQGFRAAVATAKKLLNICKQIQQEAEGVFYQENNFILAPMVCSGWMTRASVLCQPLWSMGAAPACGGHHKTHR
jgi:hypothetical protein